MPYSFDNISPLFMKRLKKADLSSFVKKLHHRRIICGKFTREHQCISVIPMKLQSNFIKITLWHLCSVYLLRIFRTPCRRNTYGGLLL